ncbi:Cerato-platanin protein [Rutstroemia sp. NJR-2017a BVV2]|nr:Cerato-platanin protein [Rutstroemia sp. NJR-2017a BVV2]
MLQQLVSFLALASVAFGAALPDTTTGATNALESTAPLPTGSDIPVTITPHPWYSSSQGILGCKINTDHVAYWPSPVDCGESMCLKLANEGREVYVLRVDQSKPYGQTPPAHDVSYNAWNYLSIGQWATENATEGGGIDVTYSTIPMTDPNCQALLLNPEKKLPVSAGTSMIYVKKCLGQPGSWASTNIGLWNIQTQACTLGYDEECVVVAGDPSCAHPVNTGPAITNLPVKNVEYGTGNLVLAT